MVSSASEKLGLNVFYQLRCQCPGAFENDLAATQPEAFIRGTFRCVPIERQVTTPQSPRYPISSALAFSLCPAQKGRMARNIHA